MLYDEAIKKAQALRMHFGDPVAVVKKDILLQERQGEYGITAFINGQNVHVGTIFTVSGSITNFYDEVVAIIR